MSHLSSWSKNWAWTLLCAALWCGFSGLHAQGRSLLWKIEGKGIKSSYLYGTMHLTCQAELPVKVQQVIPRCAQLVLELDLQAAMTSDLQQAMQMKGGLTLKQLLSEADYQALEQYILRELGLPLAVLGQSSPMMLQTLLMTRQLDCLPQSIEEKLTSAFKAKKQTVIGLETAAEQWAVLESIPYQEQAADLMQYIRLSPEAQKQEWTDLIQKYNTEDLDQLYAWMQQQKRANPDFDQTVLVGRNLKWVPKLQQLLGPKSLMIGVGAAHLAGPQGLIALLRQKGYVLTPVL